MYMAKKELMKGKPSKHLAPSGKTEKEASQRLLKAKSSKRNSSIDAMEKRSAEDQSKERQIAEETAKRSTAQRKSAEGITSIKKKYLDSHSSCRVTFRLPKGAVGPAEKVVIVGDFNKWDREASPMKKLRNGDFEIMLELPAEKEYRFRYLIDGHRWENDWSADRYEPNPHGCDDSVVIV
jgi:hypothetical protein